MPTTVTATISALAGSEGGSSYDPLKDIADRRAANKAIKKEKRDARKAFRKNKEALFKTFSKEKQEYLNKKFKLKTERLKKVKQMGDYFDSIDGEIELLPSVKSHIPTKVKGAPHQLVSFESLKAPYTPYLEVGLLLELFVNKLVISSPVEGTELPKIKVSPKWIDFLKLAKVVETPYKYTYSRKFRKYHKDMSSISRVSIPMFFSLDKLYKDFALKKSLKKLYLDKVVLCIKYITKLIKIHKKFSPKLQSFFDVLGIQPSFNIEYANILPLKLASVFPEQGPFDGKLIDECPICFLKDSELAIRLPCKHVVHKNCIDEWFKKERTCATCRAKC